MKRNLMMKKGQAALEFMMTYGWAILVVLAAIGALSYFGVLNPSKYIPTQCIPSSGFGCPGKPQISSNSIIFSIQSGLGYDVSGLAWGSSDGTLNCSAASFRALGVTGGAAGTLITSLNDSTGMTVNATCTPYGNGGATKGNIYITYMNPNSKLTEKLAVGISGPMS